MSIMHHLGRSASLALRGASLASGSRSATARSFAPALLATASGRARFFSNADAKKTEAAADAGAKAAEEPKKAPDGASLLEQTVLKLESDNKELKERVLRALAEVENMRMRSERNVADARAFGQQKFAESLLEVYDSLDRAVKEAPSGVTDTKVQKFVNGIVMTEKIMLQVFQRQGITKMTSLNQKFDPNLHGAMFETVSTTVEPGTVISEFKSGFLYNERVLRPAQVGVSKSPEA